MRIVYCPNSPWLVTSRHDTSEPVHFGGVELVEEHGSRHARVVSRRDEPSGIWAYASNFTT